MGIANPVRERRTPTERAPRRRAPAHRLEQRADGQLFAGTGPVAQAVTLRRCFPWTEPGRFLSLRNRDEDEVVLIRDPADLDSDSRRALEQAMVEAGFVLRIEKILDIVEEIEIRSWAVRTPYGDRRFQTPRDEWPRDLPDGGLLIRDVAGDLFHVPDPDRLDDDSQRHLWVFVD